MYSPQAALCARASLSHLRTQPPSASINEAQEKVGRQHSKETKQILPLTSVSTQTLMVQSRSRCEMPLWAIGPKAVNNHDKGAKANLSSMRSYFHIKAGNLGK